MAAPHIVCRLRQASARFNSNNPPSVEPESRGPYAGVAARHPMNMGVTILSFDREFALSTRASIDQNYVKGRATAGETKPDETRRKRGENDMSNRSLPALAGLVLAAAMVAMPALADGLKDEIAPTGKLRVAIAISPAGGAFWSTKTEAGGYAGVPVDLGKEMAAQLGVPVEYVVYQNSGQITDAAAKGTWDVTFLPKDPERETKMMFGPIYEVADATYIVKAGSTDHEFRNARPARHQGRGRQQHHDHARRRCASEECEGHGLSDL